MGCRVKICGLANAADAAAVAALRPDAIGFVFWTGSARAVRAEQVAEWTADLPADLLKVGVFVDVEPDEILRTMDRAQLDVAQLHGRESPNVFRAFPRPLWRSVALHADRTTDCSGWSVDAYLIDTYSAHAPGGTGRVGDWERARTFVAESDRPVWLAGGLTPENVAAAIRTVRPWGVDVSSGVERSPGCKDMEKVRKFIEQCRAE